MLDQEQFIEDCRGALAEDESHKAVREVVAKAVAKPGDLLAALGEPTEAAVTKLHCSPDLTILNVVWAPLMTIMPHSHNMWAVIGVYSGREDNIFWRRLKDDPDGKIEAAGAKSLGPSDAAPLGKDIVHSVTNPTGLFTSAIHVYGGDFFATSRSEWEPETLKEQTYDVEKTLRLFDEANARLSR